MIYALKNWGIATDNQTVKIESSNRRVVFEVENGSDENIHLGFYEEENSGDMIIPRGGGNFYTECGEVDFWLRLPAGVKWSIVESDDKSHTIVRIKTFIES